MVNVLVNFQLTGQFFQTYFRIGRKLLEQHFYRSETLHVTQPRVSGTDVK